jgi:hypothetical protein
MATLQNPGDVKNVTYIDLPATNQVAAIWTVNLRSSSDQITVPQLESTGGVGSLKTTTTVSAAAASNGQNVITIGSGSAGDTFVFATLHRVGVLNNLTLVPGQFGNTPS